MEITTEMIIAVLGIVGVMVGAYATQVKNRAVSLKDKAEAEADKAKAEAQQIRDNSTIRLEETKAKIQQDTVVQKMLEQLQTERMDWLKQLQGKEAEDSKNYRRLADTQRDNTQMLLTEIQNKTKLLTTVIEDIPARIQATNTATLTDFAKTMAAELGAVIAKEFRMQKVENALYPFPDPDDPEWKEELLIPLTPDVIIRKEPRFSDNAALQKPCAKIAPDGERARIITGRMPDWIIVRKDECWGWLPSHSVKIGQPELVGSN